MISAALLRPRVLIAALIALKALGLLLDSTVRIYLGDSAAYLYGALDDGRLPDDRSFTYSFLIRALAGPFEDVRALLVWQTIAGVAVAALLWLVLTRLFATPRGVAAIAALLLAVDPGQLYYERMVLAETFGLFWFVLFYASAARYLGSGRSAWLIAAALLSLLAITFRLNYLPVVLVISVALPLIRHVSKRGMLWRITVVHVAISIASVVASHGLFQYWVSMIFSSPPGYIARAGFMQLGLVAPLVRPEHFERVGLPRDFAEHLQYRLDEPDNRMLHMWRAGGLTREIQRQGLKIEPVARELSGMALADDPLGLVRMGLATVENYFTPEGIRHALDNDLGRRQIPYDVLWSLREHWNYDAVGLPTSVTIVSRYFEVGTWWLVACLFLLLPLSVITIAVYWRTPLRSQALLAGLIGIGLVLAHVLFVAVAFYRYLHPLPFFVLLHAAVLWPVRNSPEAIGKGTRSATRSHS